MLATFLRGVRGNEVPSEEKIHSCLQIMMGLQVGGMVGVAVVILLLAVVASQLLAATYSRRWQRLDLLPAL